jgi:membrane protein
MVLMLGFLLLISLAMSAALSAIHGYSVGLLPGAKTALEVANAAFSFGVVTVLFAMIFKLLPDTKIAWGDVWAGALTTAALFAVGKTLIGLYLGRGTFGSAYGAAASLAIILAWVYYAAQILFFGAELTQVYARRHGSRQEARHGTEGATTRAEKKDGVVAPGSPTLPRAPRIPPPVDAHEPVEAYDRAGMDDRAGTDDHVGMDDRVGVDDRPSATDRTDRPVRHGDAVYKAGVAIGVMAGRVLRLRRPR